MKKALLFAVVIVVLAALTGQAFAQAAPPAAATTTALPVPAPENMLQITGTVVSIDSTGAALVDTGKAKVYVVAPPVAPNPDGTPAPSPFKVGDRIQVAGVLQALTVQPAPAAAAAVYICTMCPDVHSSKPGRCPKCGMNLVRKQ